MSTGQATFRASLRVQARIVGALLMREVLTRYGRHNIGFMWLFVEPMMFTLGVLVLWTSLGMHKTALPVVGFVLSGYASVLLWRNTINRCGNAVEPNRALMHHRNVRVLDLFAARIILEIAGATISFIVLSLVFVAAGLMEPPSDILTLCLGWFLLAWFSIAMALLIGALSTLHESAERIWHVVSYLFLPLSGAFYMVGWLPQSVRASALLVPTVSCTELLREGMFGSGVHAQYSIGYVMAVDLALMVPALLLIKHLALRVEGA